MSLRSYGQLSDVSCLIARDLFAEYRYQGDYAEDLDLGIRLIKAGHRIAMLASVKTIHSHNRPAFYYLKRSFVDVIFLVRQFEDFEYPAVRSLRGLVYGIVSLAGELSNILSNFDRSESKDILDTSILEIIAQVRGIDLGALANESIDLEDAELSAYVLRLHKDFLSEEAPNKAEVEEANNFIKGFVGRLDHFRNFANKVYLQQDEALRLEMFAMLKKTYAATLGSYLGFLYLEFQDDPGETGRIVNNIKSELGAGI